MVPMGDVLSGMGDDDGVAVVVAVFGVAAAFGDEE